MDFALAQLALVFMPGIIWANIDSKYGAGLKPQDTILIVRAFLFGMASYTALFLIYYFCGKEFGYAELANNTKNVDSTILCSFGRVVVGSPLSSSQETSAQDWGNPSLWR